jgi:hypothetical protein
VARTPDKPGTYRIRTTADGGWRLSGVKLDGTRVRERVTSEWEAQSKADSIFGKKEVDDWGIPVIGSMRAAPETMGSLNASLGINPTGPATSHKTAEEKAKQSKFAQSMCEMLGMGWATADVALARKITENVGKIPANPNPKQVTDLADSAKETFQGWFGDREIKPWQMMILLSISIPMSMLLQSKPKPKEEQTKEPNLKSVP